MFHLAHLNIAKLKAPLDHPMIKEFNDGIEYINHLAEKSPGFVWRHKEEGQAYEGFSYRVLGDEMMIFTLSVWEDLESLKKFTYNSDHGKYYKKRREWFHKLSDNNYVLWYIPKDHRPTIAEGVARLNFLNKKGKTSKAFTFKIAFE